jgi:hypothetical protein
MEPQFVISLSELKRTRRFNATQKDVFEFCVFEVRYRVVAGLPMYEVLFPEESVVMNAVTNNAVDVVEYLNQYFNVRLVP